MYNWIWTWSYLQSSVTDDPCYNSKKEKMRDSSYNPYHHVWLGRLEQIVYEIESSPTVHFWVLLWRGDSQETIHPMSFVHRWWDMVYGMRGWWDWMILLTVFNSNPTSAIFFLVPCLWGRKVQDSDEDTFVFFPTA